MDDEQDSILKKINSIVGNSKKPTIILPYPHCEMSLIGRRRMPLDLPAIVRVSEIEKERGIVIATRAKERKESLAKLKPFNVFNKPLTDLD